MELQWWLHELLFWKITSNDKNILKKTAHDTNFLYIVNMTKLIISNGYHTVIIKLSGAIKQ